MRRIFASALPFLGIALIAAGCGGSSNASTGKASSSSGGSNTSGRYSSSATTAAATTSAGATVKLRKTSLGKMLVGPTGRSLYLFLKDKKGKSTCYNACASAWPPLTTKGKPTAGKGVNASLLTTVKRKDGTTEVVYNHHPLYYYAGDSKAGQVTGQGLTQFGAPWYVLNAKGKKIDTD
jgi:predicted lipoprotein with Yx(FWY)xxD motif